MSEVLSKCMCRHTQAMSKLPQTHGGMVQPSVGDRVQVLILCRKVAVVFSLPGCLQPEDCAPIEITPTEMNLIPLYTISPASFVCLCVITLSPCSNLCNNSASLFNVYYKLYIIKVSRVLGFLQTRALTT